jgi:hypothetical protein
VKMGGAMKGGAELPPEPQDLLAQVDEARAVAASTALGAASGAAWDAYFTVLPNDIGPAAVMTQPHDIQRFDGATFSWRGGSNAIDNPKVVVEREIVPGTWMPFADMTGEVQTMIKYPQGVAGVANSYVGMQEWPWTANFEAYSGFPKRMGSTPAGNYRFVVDGRIRQNFATESYHLVSDPFRVDPWSGIPQPVVNKLPYGGLHFVTATSVAYPASYASPFPFIDATTGDARNCDQCSFRPWAKTAGIASASIKVKRAGGRTDDVMPVRHGNNWFAPAHMKAGDVATVTLTDGYGNVSVPVVVQ